MKNRLFLSLIFSFVMGFYSFGQSEVVRMSKTSTVKRVEKLDVNKLYYKKTMTPISEAELMAILLNNPKTQFEREYDKEGNIIHYLYDPENQDGSLKVPIKTVEANSSFPNFKVSTIDKEEIELADLKGQLVILRFEIEANTFRFKKQEIKGLDNKINRSENKDKLTPMIIFMCGEDEIREGFDLPNSNFKLVANGLNFVQKYGIKRFPSTLLIDQEGNLIGHFFHSDEINLEEYVK